MFTTEGARIVVIIRYNDPPEDEEGPNDRLIPPEERGGESKGGFGNWMDKVLDKNRSTTRSDDKANGANK